MPSWSSNCFSSGMLLTCKDQLHTPIANGSMAMITPFPRGPDLSNASKGTPFVSYCDLVTHGKLRIGGKQAKGRKPIQIHMRRSCSSAISRCLLAVYPPDRGTIFNMNWTEL